MQKKISNRHPAEILISVIVIVFLIVFTYGIFVEVPYSGFYFNPSDGRILQLFVRDTTGEGLQIGDILKQVGRLSWEKYYSDRSQIFFEGVRPQQTVDITVQRGDQLITVSWVFPGFNRDQFLARFVNLWWLAYVFWLFGTVIQLFMRPKDTRWRLLIAANYLTAILLIAGSLSAFRIWGSSVVLHSTIWLMLPVYLNLHWVFPKSLGRVPTWAWNILYLIGSVLALGELLQIFPRSFYFLGFILALAGSIILLVVHFVRQPERRRAVRLLAVSILAALFPSISLGIVGILGKIPQIAPLALLALPLMPAAYFYVVYRRQLGGLEVRVNRLISAYIFLILVGTILLLLIAPAMLFPLPSGTLVFWAILLAALTAFVSIWTFPSFQAFIEQRFLDIKLPYQNLQETYSERITTSASLTSLLQLLEDEVLPSLFIRQFVFLKLENNSPKRLLVIGLTAEQALEGYDLNELTALSGSYRSAYSTDENLAYPWLRLVLPLKVGNVVLGFWLFGRRDPDDLYAQAEVPVLQSLANQTAIALSNILQTERLRAMYQANVNRFEEERMHLALDLHDSILNQLAFLQMNLGDFRPPQKFQDAYDGLTQRLREIVSDLRPPMLNYGLKPAIDELADNFMERTEDKIQVDVDIQSDGCRYPEKIELHLFRIVQEACENSLRHAQAKNITISGNLFPQEIDLRLKDDGLGFDAGDNLQLDVLIANKHFGLAGMIERAAIIEAEVGIESKLKEGTTIRIAWRQDRA